MRRPRRLTETSRLLSRKARGAGVLLASQFHRTVLGVHEHHPGSPALGFGFFDIGRTIKHKQLPGEQNDTLMGAGVGVELNILDHLILSFDWGSALSRARKNTVVEIDKGSSEAYFSATLVY